MEETFGERRAGYLLGIKPKRRPLRRIAPDRQRSWNRLAGEVIAEAGLIAQFVVTASARGVSRCDLSFDLIHGRSSLEAADRL